MADKNENEWVAPGVGHLVAANFPPSGCIACEMHIGCWDAKGMRCTPSERSDSRRIAWVKPGSLYAPRPGAGSEGGEG